MAGKKFGDMNSNIFRAKVLVSLFIISALHGCVSHKNSNDKFLKGVSHEERDSFYVAMIDYHRTLSDSICGNGKTGGIGLCGFFYNNGEYYSCLKRKNYPMFKRVIKYIITNYKFDNTCYVNLLPFWDDVHDEEFFGIALELLKEDYEPAVEGFSGFAPVYSYMYQYIIRPNIKSIEGEPYYSYMKQNFFYWELVPITEDIDEEPMHMLLYNFLKPLWDAGKIELYGEDYFRNKK